MDKILKNDRVMGVVSIITLVIVGIMFYTSIKSRDAVSVELPLSNTTEE